MNNVSVEKLKTLCIKILEAVDVRSDYAEIVADSIIYAHTREKHTHGISRMPIYVRKIKEKLLDPSSSMELVKDSAIIGVLDAKNGFGQVAAIKAMDLCIERAQKFGIGLIGVKDSNNFGTAGYIGEYAAKAGMIGIIVSNSGPAIAPTGGTKAIFGTNPICLAYPPFKDGFPIILDMACTNAARGKIRLAAKNGDKIPFGWANDENGESTDDPNEALQGTMVPIGDYKGYGLSMSIDIIAGLLTGSAFGGDVKNLNHPTEISRYGHMVFALNPTFFMTKDEYEMSMETLVRNIKESGSEEIYLPGEKSYNMARINSQIVNIKENLIAELNELAISLGICEQL